MNNTQQIFDIPPFELTAINKRINSQVLGYYLTSTANIYVENTHAQPNTDLLSQHIDEIAQHLLESDNAQLVVSIHGYANKKSDAQSRYEEIYNYASKVCNCKTVFVGYRWPAENPLEDDLETGQKKSNSLIDKIKFSFEAMPTLLLGALIANLVLGIVTISILLVSQ